MLRLPSFDVESPETTDEVLVALRTPGARLVAGGTDLLPNLKHRLEHPSVLVSLHRVASLRGVAHDRQAGMLRLGAGVTLAEIAQHADVRAMFPSLAKAAGLVAGPQIRNSATLGGNLNLDTRCRYVNQTKFWRSSIGGCLKSAGNVCHVVPGGRNCVAAMSSDCAPVLISLDAIVVLLGPGGERQLPLADYYRSDGTHHTRREEGELTTAVCIPLATGARRSEYAKWRPRGSIDFPLVSLALRFDLEADAAEAPITRYRVVAGVLGARPRVVTVPGLEGQGLAGAGVARAISEAVFGQCKPLENVPYEAPHRRHLLRMLSRRAVEGLAAP